MDSQKKQITLAAIAKELGVSTATVSLSLQNKRGVSEKTRQLVLDTVHRLGYVYNRSAARLRMQRSFTIGLIVPNLLNPFFTEFTNGVEEQLEKKGFSLLLTKTSEDVHRQEKSLRSMREYRVDGVLLCPAIGTSAKDLEPILHSRMPVVLFTRNVPGVPIDYVGADNVLGAALATEFLLSKGHTKIAFIGGLAVSKTRKERYAGFQKALEAAGIALKQDYNLPSETSLKGGYSSIKYALDLPDPPSASVCYNDVVAFGTILGLWASRRSPGKDFSVVGFDNITDAALWSPPLTTLSVPPLLIGKEAVDLLLDRIAAIDTPPRSITLQPSLIVRESCN